MGIFFFSIECNNIGKKYNSILCSNIYKKNICLCIYVYKFINIILIFISKNLLCKKAIY